MEGTRPQGSLLKMTSLSLNFLIWRMGLRLLLYQDYEEFTEN